jgi:hypothetical protein
VLAVVGEDGGRRAELLRWGLARAPSGTAPSVPAPRSRPHPTSALTDHALEYDRRPVDVRACLSSLRYGDSALFVRLAPGAPTGTRRLLLTRPLVATCTVPGRAVREFAGRWDARFAPYGAALLVDDSRLVIARATTSCGLWVGRDGKTAGTAVFPERAFSRVRIR